MSHKMQLKKFGKGLDVMSAEERASVVRRCGKFMRLFGYQVSDMHMYAVQCNAV